MWRPNDFKIPTKQDLPDWNVEQVYEAAYDDALRDFASYLRSMTWQGESPAYIDVVYLYLAGVLETPTQACCAG